MLGDPPCVRREPPQLVEGGPRTSRDDDDLNPRLVERAQDPGGSVIELRFLEARGERNQYPIEIDEDWSR